jgi:hypothetical protein
MSFKNSNNGTAENEKNGHNPLKHLGMMSICCLLPIIILTVLPLLNIKNAAANVFISGLSSLICPIMMGVMMFSMFRGGKQKGCCNEGEKKEEE